MSEKKSFQLTMTAHFDREAALEFARDLAKAFGFQVIDGWPTPQQKTTAQAVVHDDALVLGRLQAAEDALAKFDFADMPCQRQWRWESDYRNPNLLWNNLLLEGHPTVFVVAFQAGSADVVSAEIYSRSEMN